MSSFVNLAKAYLKACVKIFAACWAVLGLFVLIITDVADRPPAEPEGVVLVDSQNLVLEKALTRAQGVTTDGEYFYFSGNFFLTKMTADMTQTVEQNLFAIPPQLLKLGCNHIGGISYFDGKIYAAVEDGDEYLHPHIVIYDAETLQFTGEYYELPQSLHKDGVPWCAVDAERGVLYTAEWNKAEVLNVFSLDGMKLLKTIPLSQKLDRIQGAEVYDGILYLSSDLKTDEKPVFAANPETGEVTTAFIRNVGEGVEAEGMTVMPMEDGSLFHVMDIGNLRLNMSFKHYAPVSGE
ncbi:MAG: hypothetical protein ACI4JR_07140 [Acutalibacteraceae bacterium]